MGDKEEAKKIVGSASFKLASATQLNESEYSGPILALLLWAHATGTDLGVAPTVLAASQVTYMWGRLVLGPKASPLGAGPRYVGLFLVAKKLFEVAFR